jgi:DNA-binding SARP family transcriptional activator
MAETRRGVELLLLGPLELLRDGAVVPLGGRRTRAVLAALALHRGEIVTVDRLIEELWGERAPATASHAIEVHVSQLRKALGPERELLVTRPTGYALELDAERVDVDRFARLLDAGRVALRDGDADGAASLLCQALAVWRGSALADFTYEPFAQVEIARLEELRQACREERIEADLALGRHAELVGELESLAAAEPFRERLRAQLMLALYRCGRQADALAAYHAARKALVDELGIEPSPGLRALEAAILRQDESLLAPRPRAEPAPLAPARKIVTMLCAGLACATGLDPEALHELLDRIYDVVAAAVERHGGTIEQFQDTAVIALFGVPTAHEDDVLRAARAGLEAQEGVRALASQLKVPLELRVGLECGEVLAAARGRQRVVTGPVVGVARRLQEAAPPGAVVAGELAARVIEHAATLTPLPDGGSLLTDVSASAPPVARRLDGPFVGRRTELASLRAALAGSIAERKTQALLVVGPAGIGKSRLVDELARSAGARVLAGRCLPYGEGITYWPLRTVVPEEQLAAIVGAQSAGEIAWSFRRWCEERAREQPLLLVLDDLQHAEPTLLELVEQLAERGRGPILVVGIAREELLAERPEFLAAAQLPLEPLAEVETEVIAEALLGGRLLAEDIRAQLIETAEGNPLFLEQLLAFAAEESALGGDRPLPGSIQALLAARLDRLGPGERAILERAAVIGKEFRSGEVVGLLDAAEAPTAERHLLALVARGFLRRADDGAFSFRHVLIQDVTYRATPKRKRATLHERFADRLGDAEALDEIKGYHLERAYRLRLELGQADRGIRQLAADAGARLGAAGIRAWKRSDVPATVNLLDRATAVLPDDDARQGELLCELGLALWTKGETERALPVLQEAARVSEAARDVGLGLRVEFEATRIRLLAERTAGMAQLADLLATAIPMLERLGDERALGRAWLFSGFVEGGVHGRHQAWEEAAERALVHYRRSGWPTSTCLQQLAAALYYGPAPVARAVGRCEELLLDKDGGAAGEASVRVFVGGLQAMLGRVDEARRLVLEGSRIYEELGYVGAPATYSEAVLGQIELLAGEPAAAERVLRSACETLGRLRDDKSLSTRAAELAEALYQLGRYPEADEWALLARARAAPDDLSAQSLWRGVLAKLLARSGSPGEAEVLAREAVQLAAATEALTRQGKVLLDLAEVLRLGGREADATPVFADAASVFERKGNVMASAQVRALLAEAALV